MASGGMAAKDGSGSERGVGSSAISLAPSQRGPGDIDEVTLAAAPPRRTPLSVVLSLVAWQLRTWQTELVALKQRACARGGPPPRRSHFSPLEGIRGCWSTYLF